MRTTYAHKLEASEREKNERDDVQRRDEHSSACPYS